MGVDRSQDYFFVVGGSQGASKPKEEFMGNVVEFKAQGKAYPLSIMEQDDERWILLQQVAEAMGNKQPRRLAHDLREAGEILEGKHCRSVTERQPGDTQRRTRVYLSYRGVIRFAMRSQGQRARAFRDWAEDVLFEVMMTGSYGTPREPVVALPAPEDRIAEARREGESQGVMKGLALSAVAEKNNLQLEDLARIVQFRKLGMSQREAADAFGVDRYQLQRIETDLRKAGVSIRRANRRRQSREILGRLGEIFSREGGLT